MQPDLPSFGHMQYIASDKVSPTESRRVDRSGCEDARAQAAWAGRGEAWRRRAWACGPIPFDSCTLMSMYCMKDKSDFSIFGILEAKSVDHSFSLDIPRCLETPIL